MKTSKIKQDDISFNQDFKFTKDDQIRKTPNNQSKRRKELLCKISFEIDDEQEELLIYQQATLNQITNQLLSKINLYQSQQCNTLQNVSAEQKKAIKQEIKSKIQNNPKTEKWKKKLKQIIEQKPKAPTQSLSANITRRYLCQNKPKLINYFSYNFFKNQNEDDFDFLDQNGENKSLEIIHRAKYLQNQLLNKTDKKEMGQKTNRLYELSKRNETIKSEVMKMREQSEQKQLFSQCTFHPNIQRFQKKQNFSNQKGKKSSVFKRLYQQALEKQQLSKLILKHITQKQEQQIKKLNFVPTINQCSKQIASLKKKIHQKHGISIYQALYDDGTKKIKVPQINKNLTFRPVICQASQKMIQKSRSSKAIPKNVFLSKETLTLKTEETVQNQVNLTPHNLNLLKKNMIGKIHKQKLTSIRKDNKQNNPIEDQVFIKMKTKQTKNKSNISFVSQSKKKFDLNTEANSLSAQSIRQKSLNQSKQSLKMQKIKKETPTNLQKQTRKRQQDHNLSFLQLTGHRSLRQLDFNKDKIEEKKQKRKERLNPFQFFRLQSTKKQSSTKQSLGVGYQCKYTFKSISSEMKTNIFSNLYSLLNSQGKQEIDSSCIYKCQEIPNHLKKVLYPMAEQMQQLNVGLDYQEFIWSITRVCQTLCQKDQSQFIEWGKELDIYHQSLV